ncbi:mast cell protease 2 isoform X5 [Danio rerio]|uniref:Mast cell protease 2 isoform X5 n=1 Tax=Danio rerio TaxID=7955 RepID=A0AC58IHY2_DANRE
MMGFKPCEEQFQKVDTNPVIMVNSSLRLKSIDVHGKLTGQTGNSRKVDHMEVSSQLQSSTYLSCTLSETELSTMSIIWQTTSLLLLLRCCAPGFCMRDGIVGGKVSIPHSRPYMVYIKDSNSKLACGGFLIREDFVLTAAHCKRSHLKVYLGVNDTHILPHGIEVEATPHPKFNNAPGDDIMLLKLKTPATLNKTVNIITWPECENKEISKDCMVLGWGWQDYVDGCPSSVLKEANVTLIDFKKCGTNYTLCTNGSIGPAKGDSGGPLVCGDAAQGIVSFYTESSGVYLTRYTRISHYHQWIDHIMNKTYQQQLKTWRGKLYELI